MLCLNEEIHNWLVLQESVRKKDRAKELTEVALFCEEVAVDLTTIATGVVSTGSILKVSQMFYKSEWSIREQSDQWLNNPWTRNFSGVEVLLREWT